MNLQAAFKRMTCGVLDVNNNDRAATRATLVVAAPSPVPGHAGVPVLAIHLVMRKSVSSRLLHFPPLGCCNYIIFHVWSDAPVDTLIVDSI